MDDGGFQMSPGKIITVGSGKGGTGKTTTAAAVSSCLAAMGYKTLCIDFDAGMKDLDLSLGMPDFTVTDFTDVLTGHLSLAEAVNENPRIPGLFFLSAPALAGPGELDSAAVYKMFEEIEAEFDYCLVDSPAGVGIGFSLAHCKADMALIVATGDLPAMRDAQQAAIMARESGVCDIRLLVNRVLPRNLKQFRITIDDVIDTIGVQLIGMVREDKYIPYSLHENTPLILYRKRRSAFDYLDTARRITGEDVPLRMNAINIL